MGGGSHGRTGCKRKLYMVPCHSYFIQGTWRSNQVSRREFLIHHMGMAGHKMDEC